MKDSYVDLYIGQNINNEDIAKEIKMQIDNNRQYELVKGSIFYSVSNILNNTGNVAEQFKEVNNCNASTP